MTSAGGQWQHCLGRILLASGLSKPRGIQTGNIPQVVRLQIFLSRVDVQNTGIERDLVLRRRRLSEAPPQ